MNMTRLAAAAACAFSACAVFAGDQISMKWQFPLTQSHQGLPFGNAESGFLVWGGENVLKVTVSRDDTWDHRGGYDWHEEQSYRNIADALQADDMARVKELFRRGEVKPGEPKNPQLMPIGHFEFDLPAGAELDAGELDTGTGIARVDGIEIALDREPGVLAIRWPGGVSPAARAVPAWDHEAVSKALEPIGFAPPERFSLPGGAGFAITMPADPAIAAGCVSANGEAYLAAVRGADAAAARAELERRLAAAAARGYAAARERSLAFWTEWWSKGSKVCVPDRTIREIHDFGMYKFGSMTGPTGVPAPIQGVWYEEYRIAPWHGDYHFNINTEMAYWPAFRGNHLDSLKPLFAMIKSWWPILRENARKFAGIDDGFMLPHSVDDRCRLIGGYWAGTMDHACTAWTAQLMFRYVTMSGDIDFLRSDAYPLMKGALKVYRAMMEERDGRLSLPVSTSPEFDTHKGWGRDASFQLAACHRLARDLIAAAEMLGEQPDPVWLDIEKRLPAASFSGGRPGGEIELWEGLRLPESHRHHSHLAGYVPFDTIDYDDPALRRSTILSFNTWQREGMGLWSGWATAWAALLQVHMGHADAADLTLHIWERMFTNPGHGSRHDPYFPGFCLMRKNTFSTAGEPMEIMQIDGAMAAAATVDEMMLHERCGVARVFQGAPARWRDASFRNVLSDRGVLVSAVRDRGAVDRIELVGARDGAKICLESPWKAGERMEFTLAKGERRVLERPGRGN